MEYIEIKLPNVSSISVDGVAYAADEDGVIKLAASHHQKLLDEGFEFPKPPATRSRIPEFLLDKALGLDEEGEDGDAGSAGEGDEPVFIDGVEADREAMIAFLTAAGKKPSPNIGDKTLKDRVRAVQAAVAPPAA